MNRVAMAGDPIRFATFLAPNMIDVYRYVAASRLSDELKAAVTAALFAMGDDPAARSWLAHGFIERFVPVTDENYDDVRAMLAAAEDAGFMTLR